MSVFARLRHRIVDKRDFMRLTKKETTVLCTCSAAIVVSKKNFFGIRQEGKRGGKVAMESLTQAPTRSFLVLLTLSSSRGPYIGALLDLAIRRRQIRHHKSSTLDL